MNKTAHQIKCESCGSNIDPKKMFCEHCGAKLFVANNSEVKQKAVLTEEMVNSMLKTTSQKTTILPIILFMIVWCGMAFFGSFMAFSYGIIPPGIISLLMGAFGVTIMISQIKLAKSTNFEEISTLYKENNFKKANELLEQKLNATNNIDVKQPILTQLIILNYYKLNNLEKTKEYLFAMQTLDHELPPTVRRIANELQM
ncbi:MAG: hypothetical protein CVV59_01585 [Tenericutes bacterium HGW-Tenericutes-4]|nr:MAG: hypothetical protein CVV59_01585 [Tenericutes bacterium HGW-Tenericutes-4]